VERPEITNWLKLEVPKVLIPATDAVTVVMPESKVAFKLLEKFIVFATPINVPLFCTPRT
jgi:hypothetical protein